MSYQATPDAASHQSHQRRSAIGWVNGKWLTHIANRAAIRDASEPCGPQRVNSADGRAGGRSLRRPYRPKGLLLRHPFWRYVAAGEWATLHETPSGAEEPNMLTTVVIILIVLWALGMVTSYTMGGMLHILLVIAIIVVVVRVLQGRKVL
jgi:Family of unknown function (DUF5670)